MNAKQELIEHIENRDVKYVKIIHSVTFGEEIIIEGTLSEILPKLDFEYDAGFGRQEVFGVIWYSDGTWSERQEYDGSEWWRHVVCPPLPTITTP